ncbi:MAG: MFS transporter [Candidatus Krumholzibacteria bacterium]|nr:MFS transporter [Candidatus Krumholzibacteria bacterium]
MEEQAQAEKPWWRWLILFLISMVLFGSYYVYDAVTPINDYIQQSMNIDNSQYGLLFTLYSLPNLFFLVVVAGVLLDRLGIKKAGILYAGLCVLGSLVTSVAADKSFVWMLVGRGIFGFGSEAAILVVNKVIARWFRGKELSLAFGLNITVCRMGTFLAMGTSAMIRNSLGSWTWSVWAGTAVMFVTFLLFLVYLAVDKKGASAGEDSEEQVGMIKILKEVRNFGPSFWLVSLLCVTFYSAMFPFLSHAPRMLQKQFAMSATQAGWYTAMASGSTMIFTPIFGFLVDKFGKRGTLMLLGSLLLFPAHLLLGSTNIHPAVPFIILGVSFSLVPAALWPAVPILVKENYLGTAYGMIGWIQNAGLTLFPWLAGIVVDRNGYFPMQIMFASLGFVGLISALILLRTDKRLGTGLQLPSKEAQA